MVGESDERRALPLEKHPSSWSSRFRLHLSPFSVLTRICCFRAGDFETVGEVPAARTQCCSGCCSCHVVENKPWGTPGAQRRVDDTVTFSLPLFHLPRKNLLSGTLDLYGRTPVFLPGLCVQGSVHTFVEDFPSNIFAQCSDLTGTYLQRALDSAQRVCRTWHMSRPANVLDALTCTPLPQVGLYHCRVLSCVGETAGGQPKERRNEQNRFHDQGIVRENCHGDSASAAKLRSRQIGVELAVIRKLRWRVL